MTMKKNIIRLIITIILFVKAFFLPIIPVLKSPVIPGPTIMRFGYVPLRELIFPRLVGISFHPQWYSYISIFVLVIVVLILSHMLSKVVCSILK